MLCHPQWRSLVVAAEDFDLGGMLGRISMMFAARVAFHCCLFRQPFACNGDLLMQCDWRRHLMAAGLWIGKEATHDATAVISKSKTRRLLDPISSPGFLAFVLHGFQRVLPFCALCAHAGYSTATRLDRSWLS